jgi:putative DNA primase/helicase
LNGILDLKTGEIIDHDPGYYFSKILPIHFDSMETAPLWEKFLDEITGGDAALKNFLQQIAGYCLTASTREECFFIFWGDGRNGKSTFIKILLELLGSWGAQTPAETFLLKKGPGGFSDLARLSDMRLVAAIETDEGGKLAEGLIKSLSGNDRVAARHHYQEFFEYEPQFKIILTTNHRPQIKGNDLAIWRRVRLVPFTWTIPDEKVDPDLFEKLKTELPGILTWAVKGCFEWLNRGKLESPETVIEAVNDYKTEQDQIHRFIDDCCERGTDDDQESAKTLFDAYKAWSVENGEHYFSANKFGRRLQDLGFEKIHTMIGNAYRKIQLSGKASNERF